MGLDEEFIIAYEKYSDAIFRYCFYRVYEREKAKDLVQEVYMKTWQYLSKGNEVENIRAFLYRVARNLIIDGSRKKKESSLDEMHESGFDAKFDDRRQKEIEIDMKMAIEVIKNLDEKYREVLLLRYVDGFSPKEISSMIDETENAVSVRIHRGMKQLRKLI